MIQLTLCGSVELFVAALKCQYTSHDPPTHSPKNTGMMQVQVARSQAAKILKRKPGTGATEEIPLTVFNIIEARGFPVKDRWEEPAFGRNATSLEGLHFPKNKHRPGPRARKLVFQPSIFRCKLPPSLAVNLTFQGGCWCFFRLAPGHTASDSIHTRAIE